MEKVFGLRTEAHSLFLSVDEIFVWIAHIDLSCQRVANKNLVTATHVPAVQTSCRVPQLLRAPACHMNVRKRLEKQQIRDTNCLEVSPSRSLAERRLHCSCNCQRCLHEMVVAIQKVGRSFWSSVVCQATWAILLRTTRNRKIDYLFITEVVQNRALS